MGRLGTWAGLVALLAFILVFDYLSARHNSFTYDEPIHFKYGSNILSGDSNRFVDGTMPFTVLNAAIQRIPDLIHSTKLRGVLGPIESGRFATILFSGLLAYFVFKWARELYGDTAGIFSLFIYAFSPTLIAHSGLITTDVYAAGMVTISGYYFWRFLNVGGWGPGTVSAVLLGLSQLAKYSCIFLYPIFVMMVVLRYWRDLARAVKARAWDEIRRRLATFVKFAAFFAVVSMLVIDAGFLFNKPFVPFGEYKFRSQTFKSMQSHLGALKSFPVPLAYPYLDGIDWGKYREETGKGFGSMYLFGHLREIGGFKGYYFFAGLFKEPIAIQILAVLAVVLYVRRRARYRFLHNELFLAAPVVFYAVYMNFFFKLQIGIRHLLVAYPCFYVFCGSLLAAEQTGRRLRVAIAVLLGYLVISVISYYPYYIPYFNELVPDRMQAYKILADSNIDWGQGIGDAKAYQVKHPGAYLEAGLWQMKTYRDRHMEEYLHPQFPDTGLIIVNVNSFVGIYHPHRYKWLREKYKPIDQIDYSYLVFRVFRDDSAGVDSTESRESPEPGDSVSDADGADDR